jgi:hypothetical protein
MSNRNLLTLTLAGWLTCGFLVVPTRAQDPAAGDPKAEDASTLQTTAFAPGVVRVIPADPLAEETFDGPLTLQNFLAAYPEIQFGGESHPEGVPHFDPASRTLVEMAKEVTLRREIFCYEFAFKPLRQIIADVPQPGGKMKRQLLWYMVYRVRYVGGDLRPSSDIVAGVPIFRRIEQIHYPTRRFNPSLVLHDHTSGKEYLDRVLPGVINRIKTREQITAPLYNSIEMSQLKIPYSEPNTEGGIWGVATWEDVDPEIDFLSVDVYGLTNAFKQDGDGEDAAYSRKVLRLNFFRPGDTIDQTEDLIRFGVPAFTNPEEESYILKQYGLEKKLDYDWIFR